MRRAHRWVVAVLLAGTACVRAPAPVGRGRRSVISRDEIEASHSLSVYDVIAHRRAEFLRDRGAVSLRMPLRDRAVVFLNDQEYGSIESLRNIPAVQVEEIRYFSSTDAVLRFGASYAGGVIQLASRER